MRALVIDDSKPVRSILAKMLRTLDFEVTEAANGREGLNSIEEQGKLDLATVNWQMPEMDGLEFIRAVRANSRFRDLPLLMISGRSEPADVATALAAGADDYIVKPCTNTVLLEKLVQLGVTRSKTGATIAGPCVTRRTDIGRKIRVLVVDDSLVVRQVISSLLKQDPQIELAGTAANGQLALEKIEIVRPDVVLLDVEMPVLDGIQTLKAIRKTHPRLSVIMFSSLTERGAAVTTDALLLGANDYVTKPGGTQMQDRQAGMKAIREELIPRIKQLSLPRIGWTDEISGSRAAATGQPTAAAPMSLVRVVTIGLSTGGPCALAHLLPGISRDCPVPILIVQHMPPLFTKHLAQRLREETQLDVAEGTDGEVLEPGKIRVAPGGFHMVIAASKRPGWIELNQAPPVNACRPSADVLFQSAADVYQDGVLAVVMTGMGNDGLTGAKSVVHAGGHVLVQDQSSSVVWGMPGHVARAGLASAILPLDKIACEIMTRVQHGR